MPDMTDFIAQLRDRDDGPRLTDAQQVRLLRQCFADLSEKHDFQPGDIIAHKFPEHADTLDPAQPHMFLEWIKPISACSAEFPDPTEYGSAAAARVYDCRIACIGGKRFSIYLFDSRFFRPATEADFGAVVKLVDG